MCHWNKGVELRYSISLLEQWIRDSKLQDSNAAENLEIVIQASQLLQARKTEKDIKSICEMCNSLTIAQIQRILYMYTPIEAYEEKCSRSFIEKVTQELKEKRLQLYNEGSDKMQAMQQVLIIETQRPLSVHIPFNPSSIGLETIEINEQMNINFLKKI
jgi:myosin V